MEGSIFARRVMVVGGLGSIGRNLVKFLVDSELCSFIRVVDKKMSAMAHLSDEHARAFESDIVEVVQADLTRESHLDKAFREGETFRYVFNLAGETRYGMPVMNYESACRALSVTVAKKAQQHGARFIQVSTGHVYRSQSKRPSTEDAELEPFTTQAIHQLEAEQQLQRIAGLDLIIARLATVYGPGDQGGLMPRCVCAASYVHIGEQMRFLWDAKTKLNTVHVVDVCRALWHLANQDRPGGPGEVYNIVDENDTDQGKVNKILGHLFGIKTGFHGKLLSNLARLRMSDVVDDANQKHLQPWAELCRAHGVSTPLSPYMHKELLGHNHVFMDGSKLRSTGFEYRYPNLELDEVAAVIHGCIDQKIFPPILAWGASEEKNS